MSYAKKYGLQVGDQIVTPLFATGITKHFAVYLGINNGIEWIAENHKVYGVRVIPAHTYFKDVNEVSRIIKFQGAIKQRNELFKIAKSLEGTSYDLVGYNCEHFATQITEGVSTSRQVNILIAGFFATLLIGLVNE